MKIKCPDCCVYRQKEAPMCGFCLLKILDEMENEKKDGGEEDGSKEQVQGAGKAP